MQGEPLAGLCLGMDGQSPATLTTKARVRSQASHVGVMVDKATFGKVVLQAIRFSPAIIITVMLNIH